MREITVKVYKFEELSEEAQKKALEECRQIDWDWWDNITGLLDMTLEEMNARHIKPKDYPTEPITYKIRSFHMFDNHDEYIQFDDIEIRDRETFRKFLRIPKALWEHCDFWFTTLSEEQNTELMITYDGGRGTMNQQIIVNRGINIMADKIEVALEELKDIYRDMTCDEEIEEKIAANKFEFYENGSKV